MTKKNAVEKHGFNPNTVFEDILAGKLPAEFVYKDELVTAFMDIQPITDGHVLVIPNIKAATLDELKPEYGERMFLVAQKIALALKTSTLACEGINFFLADGQAAGQSDPPDDQRHEWLRPRQPHPQPPEYEPECRHPAQQINQ